jgi:hypothetical protein
MKRSQDADAGPVARARGYADLVWTVLGLITAQEAGLNLLPRPCPK